MNDLLMYIDQIDQTVNDSEINVLGAMSNVYTKSIMMIEQCENEDVINNIFQEGEKWDKFKEDVKEPVFGKKGESVIKRIIMFIPRLILSLLSFLLVFVRVFRFCLLYIYERFIKRDPSFKRRESDKIPVKFNFEYISEFFKACSNFLSNIFGLDNGFVMAANGAREYRENDKGEFVELIINAYKRDKNKYKNAFDTLDKFNREFKSKAYETDKEDYPDAIKTGIEIYLNSMKEVENNLKQIKKIVDKKENSNKNGNEAFDSSDKKIITDFNKLITTTMKSMNELYKDFMDYVPEIKKKNDEYEKKLKKRFLF